MSKTKKQTIFTHGQKVTCKIRGIYVEDAMISITRNGIHICQNVVESNALWDSKNKLGYEYSIGIDESYYSPIVTELRPQIRNYDFIEIGDEINNKKDTRTILGICGKVILLSNPKNKNEFDKGFTIEQLKTNNYKMVQVKPTKTIKTLTLRQVCNELGRTIKIKK
jgi:hypothetical protein